MIYSYGSFLRLKVVKNRYTWKQFFFLVPVDIMCIYLFLWCFFIIENCLKLSKMAIHRNEGFFSFEIQKVIPKRRKTHY